MTDRINALVVILEENVRDDDIKAMITAIYQLRNVLSVKTNVNSVSTEMVAEMRVKARLREQVLEIFK